MIGVIIQYQEIHPGRPHEILKLKVRDIVFKTSGNYQYARNPSERKNRLKTNTSN